MYTAGTKPPAPQLANTVDVTQILLVIFYLVLIVIGAYFLTRYIGRKRLQQGMRSGTRKKTSIFGRWSSANPEPGHLIAVVDRIVIDREKTLMVVEFEGKYYLLGTTADGLECFDRVRITPQDGADEAEEEASSFDYDDAARPTPERGASRFEAAGAEGRHMEPGSAGATQKAAGAGKNDGRNGEPEQSSRAVNPAAGFGSMRKDAPAAQSAELRSRISQPEDETFGQRFRRAFSIVLRSYLPAGMRDKKPRPSFDEELRARTHRNTGAAKKKDDES